MATRAEAANLVDGHVDPKPCFVTSDNGKDWRPIDGTGCAHYVAHKLGIRRGAKGSNACMEGFPLRVPDLLLGMVTVGPDKVKVGDVWANVGRTHCGLVTAAPPAPAPDKPRTFDITHSASNRHRPGGPGVHTDKWPGRLQGGLFYRPAT